ncbi:hypothetical protein B0H16DRAFT_1490973 [Mycena metata]|uniref:ZZ-type domain-containing protein n=1 Tax=Mycena metata TaxID=1033252 RepID=A0AAD7KJV7_9AGAR|nr:hypothetical protein B0H16DRAFT_1490973 [Mycena metata]
MPFTVKATYGRSGELRKLSFPSLPTYTDLCNQVSPTTTFFQSFSFLQTRQRSSILIGREVHNADQWNSAVAPYTNNGLWSNAMLRFTVFDETPHKLPAGFVPDNTSAATLVGGNANPFISVSHIPHPPIILSSAGSSATMDVDASTQAYSPASTSTTPMPQQHHLDPQFGTAAKTAACCAVSQGKIEMEGIVSKFKDDLDRILKSSFSTPNSTAAPFMAPPPSSFCLFKYCTTCAKIFQGPWFACENCSIVVCLGCHERQTTSFCVAASGPHAMKKEVCAACPTEDQPSGIGMTPTPWAAWQPLTPQWTPPQQGYTPVYPFGLQAPQITPFIPDNFPRAPAPLPPLPVPSVAQVPEAPAPPAPPVIHRGVVCDGCDNVVEGIRHKCLDCLDYDLCTVCIESGSAERHNPFHEFLEIKEPGRVIVHTVYSGDGERDAQFDSSTRAPGPAPAPHADSPAVHYATCNLCDSRIRGDRYKCTDCPDFDTCSNCFSITREQHPHHSFVKLGNAADYIRREDTVPPIHFVTCDGCNKTVSGVRYKCMHPECPDFDLCESCEAFPIPVHPDNHPLLKMRSPSTVVPTVYRVGQTRLIDPTDLDQILQQQEVNQRGRSPHRARSRSPSFDRGYMANPNTRSNTMPASFFDSAPSPIPPPSPFFFRSESSRSSSPITAYQAPLSPPYVPRPLSPMMMPGGLYDEPVFTRQPQPAFNYSFRVQPPTASRFSHSPSPSPPLFRTRSRSATPPPRARQATWAPADAPIRLEPARWTHFETLRALREQQERAQEQQERAREQQERDQEQQQNQRDAELRAQQAARNLVDTMARERIEAMHQLEEAHRNLEQHVEEQQIRWASPAAVPVPAPAAPESLFPSFWPKSSEELRHLMQHDHEPVVDAFSRLSVQEEPAAVMDSPLTGEALLNRPTEMSQASKMPVFNHSLAALLNGYESENEEKEVEQEVEEEEEEPSVVPTPVLVPTPVPAIAHYPKPSLVPVPIPPLGLRASFVNDVTLPDGQIFPPGAEFMKCWQMVNSGGVDWPAETELVYVAGERLARESGGPSAVAVGSVKIGAEVELWTGELKAPESEGHYVSYWRLRDGEGNLFGDNIWICINVAETRSNESSLSSSSIIVMPRGAQSVPTSSASGAPGVSRGEVEEDEGSEHDSDTSSVSLISVPTSEDDEEWASVPSAEEPQAQRYVVLYDDASSQSSGSGSDIE